MSRRTFTKLLLSVIPAAWVASKVKAEKPVAPEPIETCGVILTDATTGKHVRLVVRDGDLVIQKYPPVPDGQEFRFDWGA